MHIGNAIFHISCRIYERGNNHGERAHLSTLCKFFENNMEQVEITRVCLEKKLYPFHWAASNKLSNVYKKIYIFMFCTAGPLLLLVLSKLLESSDRTNFGIVRNPPNRTFRTFFVGNFCKSSAEPNSSNWAQFYLFFWNL